VQPQRKASVPKSNVDFWQKKFARTVERDQQSVQQLLEGRWRVGIVWECAPRELGKSDLIDHIEEFVRNGSAAFAEWP